MLLFNEAVGIEIMALDDRMIKELLIEKDLEGNDFDLMQVKGKKKVKLSL
jgi:hypothetical protein